jgi:hypothetical protein
MVKREVQRGPHGRVIVTDTVTRIEACDADAIVVTGSHGGTSAAEFALSARLRLVVFNDAGVGKDQAGIAGLARLDQRSIAAATVSHISARIGDAEDAWRNGVVSYVNRPARQLGVMPGQRLAEIVAKLVGVQS